MTAPRRKREIFANPFFAILLIASVVFVLTVLAYLSSAGVLDSEPAAPPQGARSIAFGKWLDRNAPIALGVELLVMLLAGTLAMLLDPWFSARSKTKPPK
jgi:hypothetical protein